MDQTPPPGYYADPDGNQRWWDGRQWGGLAQAVAPQQAQPAPARRKTPWIIGGVVALLLLLVGGGITAGVLLAGDSDGSDGDGGGGGTEQEEATPEDTVQAYFDALAEDDCEGMVEQVTDRAAEKPSMDCATYDRNSMDGVEASNEILETDENGDEATVRARERFERPEGVFEAECYYYVVEQEGVWLIDEADCNELPD